MNHRVVEWCRLEGNLKIISSQPPRRRNWGKRGRNVLRWGWDVPPARGMCQKGGFVEGEEEGLKKP